MSNNELLLKWQNRLGLQDWVIVVRDNCTPDDFQIPNAAGECDWREINKCAVIRILNPNCYGDRIMPFNYERILVHELLHIKFTLLDNSDNDLQNRMVHQLIEDMAKALVYDSEEK